MPLWWSMAGRPAEAHGDVYWGVHLPLAAIIRRRGVSLAVGPGTYFGSGALHLAALLDQVWTVERDERLYTFCKNNYASLCPSVNFVLGDSADSLRAIAGSLAQPALFILDAHWFPAPVLGSTGHRSQCPVMDELAAIADAGGCKEGSVVIVDDADMFLGSLPEPFDRQGFPSVVDVVDYMRSGLGAGYVQVVDDIVVAGPSRSSRRC